MRTDYNEEWFPINDPTWKDKTGQPYGKVPTNLDWISYDVRAASPPAGNLLSVPFVEWSFSLTKRLYMTCIDIVWSVLPAQQCLVAPTDVRVPSEPVQ